MASGERSRDCASPPNAALCPRPGLCHGRLAHQEALLRRSNARAERERVTAFAKRQLHTAERGKDLELAERAEVADAEHAAAERAKAHPECEVEAIARAGDQKVGVEALGHDDRGDTVGVRVGLLAQDAETPRKRRRAHALRQAMVPREDLTQALGEEHVKRL